MSTAQSEVLAPKELTLPARARTPSANNRHGEIYISGGYLCYVSGANIIMLNNGSEAFLSGANLLS